jgi:small subunit ribosomal protein S20
MRVRPALARISRFSNPVGPIAQTIINSPVHWAQTKVRIMANTPQAKKRARQNEARFAINKMRRSRIRTELRKVEEAIASGDKTAAAAALKVAQPELMRGVTKGVFHKNTVARKMSRLSSRVKALA